MRARLRLRRLGRGGDGEADLVDSRWDCRRMVVKHEQDKHVVWPRGDIFERVGELVRGCVDRVRVSGDRGLTRDEDRFHVQIVDDVPFSGVRIGAGYRYEREVGDLHFDRHVRPDDGALGGQAR